jgi:hypothetical protein
VARGGGGRGSAWLMARKDAAGRCSSARAGVYGPRAPRAGAPGQSTLLWVTAGVERGRRRGGAWRGAAARETPSVRQCHFACSTACRAPCCGYCAAVGCVSLLVALASCAAQRDRRRRQGGEEHRVGDRALLTGVPWVMLRFLCAECSPSASPSLPRLPRPSPPSRRCVAHPRLHAPRAPRSA